MFLRFLQKHNPGLIDYGIYLLEHGLAEPDTYIVDLDAIEENAGRLNDLAHRNRVVLYFMAKQLGRNPEIARRVLSVSLNEIPDASGGGKNYGFTGLVTVDFREARILCSAGLPVKHLGHLCQIPRCFTDEALDMNPEVITLFSAEKARELSEAACRRRKVQDVLLRIYDSGDIFYPGQEGGFPLVTLPETLGTLEKYKNIRITGVTSFPCFLFREEEGRSLPAPNACTLVRAATLLEERGIRVTQINMPSCNSLSTLPLAAGLGATHLEPGHSLTGTNPDNLYESEPLKPALLYMTEISHQYEGSSFCYGGGYYRRSNMCSALVKTSGGLTETGTIAPDPLAIDYHLRLSGLFPPGSPVCMSFRTQVFVTRSRVALVEGLSSSAPALHSVWDSGGSLKERL